MSENDPLSTRSDPPAVEVKTERDVNLITKEPVLRIFARRGGARRWEKMIVVASKRQPLEYLEAHAQEIGEAWLRMVEDVFA